MMTVKFCQVYLLSPAKFHLVWFIDVSLWHPQKVKIGKFGSVFVGVHVKKIFAYS